jgi:Ca-activated chloride channel family protein
MMAEPEEDLYEVLGVSPNASTEAIKRAYRNLARRYHPDSGGEEASVEHFRKIQAAYDVLGDTLRRRAYDRRRAERLQTAPSLFTWTIQVSQQRLPVVDEEQVFYALVDIQPAKEVRTRRAAINLSLVIDRSTSMQGIRLDCVKAAAHQIVDSLQDTDFLSIVVFSDRAEVIVPSQALKDRAPIHNRIAGIWAAGGTEILHGLQAGLEQVRTFHSDKTISHVVLLTDGQTYGDEEKCVAEARRAGLQRVGISTMGIGEDWNDTLLSEMARQASGRSAYIAHPRQIRQVLQDYIHNLRGVVVHNLRLTPRFADRTRLEGAFRCIPQIERLVYQDGAFELGLLQYDSYIRLLLELAIEPLPAGKQRLAQLELEGTVPGTEEKGRLIYDLETEFAPEVEEETAPAAIINVVNRVNLYRLQESAWRALENGRPDEARQRLEAVATRLLDLGEQELAHVALLEAGRVSRGETASNKGLKTIRFGTRSLGMKG